MPKNGEHFLFISGRGESNSTFDLLFYFFKFFQRIHNSFLLVLKIKVLGLVVVDFLKEVSKSLPLFCLVVLMGLQVVFSVLAMHAKFKGL